MSFIEFNQALQNKHLINGQNIQALGKTSPIYNNNIYQTALARISTARDLPLPTGGRSSC